MSLILRKENQVILDANGLQNYHTTISTGTKMLQIVGECGKPLITIHGIVFTRLQPTKAEIGYANELLEAFIVKYIVDIDVYINELIKFKSLPVYLAKNGVFTIGSNYSTDKHYLVYLDGLFKVTIYENKSTTLNLDDTNTPMLAISNFKFDNKLFTDAENYMKNFIKYEAAEKVLEELAAKLSVCDI